MAFIGNMLMAAEEMTKLQQIFMKMDKDHNGFLSIEELRGGIKENIGPVFLTEDYYE